MILKIIGCIILFIILTGLSCLIYAIKNTPTMPDDFQEI